jgi:hypothetical protein
MLGGMIGFIMGKILLASKTFGTWNPGN